MMAADTWNSLNPMPAGREFEVYHPFDALWNNFTFHSHAFMEIFFFITGSIQIMVEDRLYNIQPWDMLIFPPGTMHKNLPLGNNVNYERAYFYASESFLRSISGPECNLYEMYQQAAKNKLHHFHLTEEIGKDILKRIDGIIALADDGNPVSQMINRCQMMILMASVGQLIQDFSADPTSITTARTSQILHYINQHFTEDLSLDELANHFYISKYHLLREFKEYTSTTIHQYLMKKRIVYAQLLLQQGTSPMQAAQACGFTDYAGFFRAFKRSALISPQEYAKTQSRQEQ